MDRILRHPFDSYAEVEKVGEGTYGVVYKARRRSDGVLHALKKINLPQNNVEGLPVTCLREISILKELDHPCVVKLLDVAVHNYQNLYMIFEYIDWDLKRLMDAYGKALPTKYVKAVTHCHTHRVLHRDLKPQNLLVTQGGVIKLADFGLARDISVAARCYTHEVVTLWYRAPEVLLDARCYSTAVDAWSLACIFAEMSTGHILFQGDSEIDQLHKIFHLLGTPTAQSWTGVEKLVAYRVNFPKWEKTSLLQKMPELGEDGVGLLSEMLIFSPMARLTAKGALCHRYLLDTQVNLPPMPSMLRRT